jgi:GNAT superfamily N-acetyltransferase
VRSLPEDVVVRRATFDEILTLRHAELRRGLPLDAACFPGDHDPGTRHLGAFVGGTGENVGCASFMPSPFRDATFQLRGMATRADMARRGVGGALLGFATSVLPVGTRLWCNARVVAVPFYRRMGWTVESDEFEVPTAGPHVKMLSPCNLETPSDVSPSKEVS